MRSPPSILWGDPVWCAGIGRFVSGTVYIVADLVLRVAIRQPTAGPGDIVADPVLSAAISERSTDAASVRLAE